MNAWTSCTHQQFSYLNLINYLKICIFFFLLKLKENCNSDWHLMTSYNMPPKKDWQQFLLLQVKSILWLAINEN